MFNYQQSIHNISQIENEIERDQRLSELPLGLTIGKKFYYSGKKYSYSYNERSKYIMEQIHGLSIESQFENQIVERVENGEI